MTSSDSRGFTLIELLVVIAIIGILSSVAIGSLMLGRLKAADAAIQSDLHAIASQMEIYYTSNNNFGTTYNQTSALSVVPTTGTSLYVTDTVINNALKDAMKQSGSGQSAWAATGKVAGSSGTIASTWAVAVRLKSDSSSAWCIDSGGTGEKITFSASSNPLGGNTAPAQCP
ncbi:MAG: type IV pilin protein [Bacillota bacterium]